jgi:uncharacterized protein (TIGR02391 family)
MVPLSVDFYKLEADIRKEIVNRIERTEIITHPLEGAWLLYALAFEGKENNLFFKRFMAELENWAISQASGNRSKDLAPLSMCGFLSANEDVKNIVVKKANEILAEALQKSETKFSVINDPEQIFCISLLKDGVNGKTKTDLVRSIRNNITGRIARKALFIASLLEFGESSEEFRDLKSAEDVEDVILVLWLFERYRKNTEDDLLCLWKAFEGIQPSIEISEGAEKNYVSNRELGFLYEAVIAQISEPDPNMLFDLYPIHPEIKKIASNHFKNKKYATAVFQAIQKLKELLENLTGIKDKMEVDLIRATMSPKKLEKIKFVSKKPDEIVIKFNDCLDEVTGMNEQEGLALIAEGLFKAFRHPKGHKPEDHPLLEMKPYEALDQLIIIDYIWRRVESAKIKKKA